MHLSNGTEKISENLCSGLLFINVELNSYTMFEKSIVLDT